MAMKLRAVAILFATLSSVSAQEQMPSKTNGPIAFTIVSSPAPHGATRSQRAAFIYPWASGAAPHIFQIHDIFFGEKQGTGFMRWLQGDQRGRALITRISFPEGACLDDKDCMTDDCHRHGFDPQTCRIYSTISDDCVVESSKLIGCPTRLFSNHDRLTGDVVGPYSYNESAVPVYDAKKKLYGFQFATHPVPPAIQNRTEVWQVEPDGTNAILLGPASTHGCLISPDQAFMICEETKSSGVDIVLRKFDGTSVGSILKPDEFERMLDGRWSPDSSFFVYFSEIGPNRTTKVVYQSVEDLDHLADAKNHRILADDQTPAVFCPLPQCGPVGTGSLGTDFLAFSPPQPGETRSKWIAFTVLKQLPTHQYKKILYGLSLNDSLPPKEIELPNDVAYPTFSPDGKWIAFLSITSSADPRSQLFIANWKTKKYKQLTHIKETDRQVYNPHWSE